jgi:single-strand DNA-binding protein
MLVGEPKPLSIVGGEGDSMSVNKVILVGRLGQKPELKQTQSGAVANFGIATNEKWMKDGQKQERTEWHKIVVWGKTAENCAQYLDKGSQVFLEGKIQTRQWQDKEGQTKYTTEIHALGVTFLDSRKSVDGQQPQVGAPDPTTTMDDIPF